MVDCYKQIVISFRWCKLQKRYLVLLFIVGFFLFYGCLGEREHPKPKLLWGASELASLHEGDIVCRAGQGSWSEQFREKSRIDKRFSHCGIIVKKDLQWFVIHSDANDVTGVGVVRQEPLQNFLENGKGVEVYRLDISSDVAQRICQNAESYLNVPFDARFDIRSDEKVYCSELVYLCVNQAVGKEWIRPAPVGRFLLVTVDDVYLQTNARLVLKKWDSVESSK